MSEVKFRLVQESDHLELKAQRMGGGDNVLVLADDDQVYAVYVVCRDWLVNKWGHQNKVAANDRPTWRPDIPEPTPPTLSTDYLDRLKSALYAVTDIELDADRDTLITMLTNEIRAVKNMRCM